MNVTIEQLALQLQNSSRVLSSKGTYPEMADMCEAANIMLGRIILSDGDLERPALLTALELSRAVQGHPVQAADIVKRFDSKEVWAIPTAGAPEDPNATRSVALVLRVKTRDDFNMLPFNIIQQVKPEWRPFIIVLQADIFRPTNDVEDRVAMAWCGAVVKTDGTMPLVFSPAFAEHNYRMAPKQAAPAQPVGRSIAAASNGLLTRLLIRLTKPLTPSVPPDLSEVEKVALATLEPSLRAVTEIAFRALDPSWAVKHGNA